MVTRPRSRARSTFERRFEAWTKAAKALEAFHPIYRAAEEAFMTARDPAVRSLCETAFLQAEMRQDELSARLAAAKSELYRSHPETLDEVLTLLEVIRRSEEDIFDDAELAAAFDSSARALRRLPRED